MDNNETRQTLSTPNFSVDLASTIDSRAVDGYTNIVTNSVDQRKINTMYEPVNNSVTGKVTLHLTKRPGVGIDSNTFGTSGQVGYMVVPAGGGPFNSDTSTNNWVISTSGNDLRASSSATTTTIVTDVDLKPYYWDKINVGGTDTLLLQTIDNVTKVQRIWYSSAIGTFTEITDSDLLSSTNVRGKMEHIDGWTFALVSDKTIKNSDLNSIANWSASSYIAKQITQDTSDGLMKYGKFILALGRETCEFFRNVGNSTGSPLQSVPEMYYPVGLMDPSDTGKTHYYTRLDDRLYFYGRHGSPSGGGIYSFDGTRFEKISTIAIDKIIQESNVYAVYPVTIAGQRAIAFSIQLVTAATQISLIFFPEWNDWAEWNSTVFSTINSGRMFLGVGSNQHRLYAFGAVADDIWQDNSTNYEFRTQFALPVTGNNIKRMHMCGVIGDIPRSATNLAVSFTDDDYQTFNTARNIDLTSKMPHLYRCGAFRKRAVRLSYTGANEIRLEKFLARIE